MHLQQLYSNAGLPEWAVGSQALGVLSHSPGWKLFLSPLALVPLNDERPFTGQLGLSPDVHLAKPHSKFSLVSTQHVSRSPAKDNTKIIFLSF